MENFVEVGLRDNFIDKADPERNQDHKEWDQPSSTPAELRFQGINHSVQITICTNNVESPDGPSSSGSWVPVGAASRWPMQTIQTRHFDQRVELSRRVAFTSIDQDLEKK